MEMSYTNKCQGEQRTWTLFPHWSQWCPSTVGFESSPKWYKWYHQVISGTGNWTSKSCLPLEAPPVCAHILCTWGHPPAAGKYPTWSQFVPVLLLWNRWRGEKTTKHPHQKWQLTGLNISGSGKYFGFLCSQYGDNINISPAGMVKFWKGEKNLKKRENHGFSSQSNLSSVHLFHQQQFLVQVVEPRRVYDTSEASCCCHFFLKGGLNSGEFGKAIFVLI